MDSRVYCCEGREFQGMYLETVNVSDSGSLLKYQKTGSRQHCKRNQCQIKNSMKIKVFSEQLSVSPAQRMPLVKLRDVPLTTNIASVCECDHGYAGTLKHQLLEVELRANDSRSHILLLVVAHSGKMIMFSKKIRVLQDGIKDGLTPVPL